MTEQRSALIAIVSKDDGKKAVGLDWQNNNSALANHAFFVHFVAVVARLSTARNFSISRFMEDGNTRHDFLFSFVKLGIIF